MGDQSWIRARAIFERAIELDAGERGAFVERECGGDPAVGATVASLLASWSSGSGPLKPLEAAELGRRLIAAALPESGERIGAYRIERLLGAGGMGSVYLAEQDRPTRKVALKLMRPGLTASDGARRFEAEAGILGHLRHPAIAMIFELGQYDGPAGPTPFFAMEYVEGARDLASYCHAERLSVRARVVLLLHVCGALQHAHSKGVIHRDLKPGNVLVDEAGRVKVIDFGVARMFRTDLTTGHLSVTGAALGTVAYASPEQLRDDWRDIDVRTDVYSLGATMYEVFADRPPIAVADRPLTDVVDDICNAVPPAPSKSAPGVPRELDWIVLKCLEKDRERRYPSVDELAADLRRFLDGDPVSAGPASRVYRARKFARRHWLALSASAIVLASLSGAATVYRFSMLEAREQEALALRAREIAELDADAARKSLRRESAVVNALGSMLGSVAPEEDGRSVTLFELLERRRSNLETQFADDPELRLGMQIFLMRAYSNLGLGPQTLELGLDALATLERHPETPVASVSALQFFVARRLFEAGRIEEASALIERAAANVASGDGEMTVDGVAALRMQAMLLEKRGRRDEAFAGYEHALKVARETLGDVDMLTLTLMSDVAVERANRKLWAEAETLAREAFEGAAKTLPSEHPQLLMFRMRLGSVLAAAGKTDEALALQVELAEQTSKTFGDQHRNTVQALRELAQAYSSAGRFEDACATGERAMELVERHHRNDGELQLTVRTVLGTALRRAKRYREAAECWGVVIAIGEASGRANDPNVFNARITFAQNLCDADDAAGAEASLRVTLEGAAGVLPPAHSALGRARLILARAILLQERVEDAYAEYEAAYQMLSKFDDANSKSHARDALAALERTAAALGRDEDAARWKTLQSQVQNAAPER